MPLSPAELFQGWSVSLGSDRFDHGGQFSVEFEHALSAGDEFVQNSSSISLLEQLEERNAGRIRVEDDDSSRYKFLSPRSKIRDVDGNAMNFLELSETTEEQENESRAQQTQTAQENESAEQTQTAQEAQTQTLSVQQAEAERQWLVNTLGSEQQLHDLVADMERISRDAPNVSKPGAGGSSGGPSTGGAAPADAIASVVNHVQKKLPDAKEAGRVISDVQREAGENAGEKAAHSKTPGAVVPPLAKTGTVPDAGKGPRGPSPRTVRDDKGQVVGAATNTKDATGVEAVVQPKGAGASPAG